MARTTLKTTHTTATMAATSSTVRQVTRLGCAGGSGWMALGPTTLPKVRSIRASGISDEKLKKFWSGKMGSHHHQADDMFDCFGQLENFFVRSKMA